MKTAKHIFLALLLGLSTFAKAQCPTFGNYPPPYNGGGAYSPNYLLGTKHTLSTSFSLTGLGFDGSNTGSGIQMAIYTDAGNVAANLVAYTNAGTVGSGPSVLSVTTPTLLLPGDYWIMAIYDQNASHVPKTTAAPNTVCYVSLTYGAAIPATASWLTYTGQDFNYWAVGGGLTVNSPAPICQGSAVTLSVSGATTYLWDNGATTPSITVSPLANTSYTVNGTGGCAGTAIITVTVNPSPVVSITGASTVCLNSSISQTVTTAAPNYTWNTGSNANVISLTPTSNTVVSVSATGANNCVATATSAITVLSLPPLSIGNATICAGINFTIAPNETIPYTVSGNNAIVSPTVTTNYTVTGIAANTCTSAVTTTVFVNALPTITVSSTPSVICKGKTTTITVAGATTYSWNTGATASVVAITPSATISYTISGTDANNCTNKSVFTQTVDACLGIASVNANKDIITIYPNPTNGVLNVELNGAGSVVIYNSIGQLMFSQQNATFKNQLDISGYKQGIYYMTVTTENETITQKIIKE